MVRLQGIINALMTFWEKEIWKIFWGNEKRSEDGAFKYNDARIYDFIQKPTRQNRSRFSGLTTNNAMVVWSAF